jgi:hypothetical protein
MMVDDPYNNHHSVMVVRLVEVTLADFLDPMIVLVVMVLVVVDIEIVVVVDNVVKLYG